jgi:hypothetical protein
MKLLARLERLEPRPEELITKTWELVIVHRNEAGELVEEPYERITWTSPKQGSSGRTKRWRKYK